MRKLFKERKLFQGGNYMRKYGNFALTIQNSENCLRNFVAVILNPICVLYHAIRSVGTWGGAGDDSPQFRF